MIPLFAITKLRTYESKRFTKAFKREWHIIVQLLVRKQNLLYKALYNILHHDQFEAVLQHYTSRFRNRDLR